MFDLKTIDSAFNIAAFLFGSAAFATSWLTRGSKANAVKISSLEAENATLANRLAEVERKISVLPTKDDFHKLEMELSEMNGSVSNVSTKLEALDYIAKRIDDFFLNRGVSK